MKHLLLFVLSLFTCVKIFAQVSHWQSLGFRLDRYPMTFYTDTAKGLMYMTGLFEHVNDTPAMVVAWDGQRHSRPYPAIKGAISGPMIRYKEKLYISNNAGAFRIGDRDTAWERIDIPKRWIGGFYPYGDKLIVPSGVRLPNGQYKSSIGFWDGQVWTDSFNVDTVLEGKFWMITSVAEYKGELYFAGNMNPAGKPQISEIVRFDGKHWKDVGGGIQNGALGGVAQMLVWRGDLYVAGLFSESEGAPGNCIARWDGQRWHRLGGGLTQYGGAAIYQMTVWRDRLYVVGPFQDADGIPIRNNVACWDGRKWCSVGDTIDYVGAIGVLKDEVYIGGSFHEINGDSSYHMVAKWTGGDYMDTCAEGALSIPQTSLSSFKLYPNPAVHGRFTVSAEGFASSDISIVVRSISGREVFGSTFRKAGNSFNEIIDLGGVPHGLYFVELRAGTERLITKIVIQ